MKWNEMNKMKIHIQEKDQTISSKGSADYGG